MRRGSRPGARSLLLRIALPLLSARAYQSRACRDNPPPTDHPHVACASCCSRQLGLLAISIGVATQHFAAIAAAAASMTLGVAGGIRWAAHGRARAGCRWGSLAPRRRRAAHGHPEALRGRARLHRCVAARLVCERRVRGALRAHGRRGRRHDDRRGARPSDRGRRARSLAASPSLLVTPSGRRGESSPTSAHQLAPSSGAVSPCARRTDRSGVEDFSFTTAARRASSPA